MKLSVAYNRENLIDENYVMDKLKLHWIATNHKYVWGSNVSISDEFNDEIRVWICLSFGYKEELKESLYYSSFGIDYNYDGVYYAIHVNVDHCWGTDYPNPWEVICFYREEIRKVLFKSGSRNKRIFNYPDKKRRD